MALTGRAGLFAVLGAVVVLVSPSPGQAVLGWLLVLIVLIAIDLAFAGSVRALRFRRDGDQLVRLGDTATITLLVENPTRRRVKGMLRDGWPPSAQARPSRQPIVIPAGERRRVTTTLTPLRRG